MLDEEKILRKYLECVLFTDSPYYESSGDDSNFVYHNFDVDDFTAETIDAARQLVTDFIDMAIDAGLEDELERWDREHGIGYDLWLTRNGHGTGFWDRETSVTATALTDFAHSFGSAYAYLTEDEQINIE